MEDGFAPAVNSLEDHMEVLPHPSTAVAGALLWDLRALREVNIPDGAERIGSYWFAGTGIRSVTIPESVRKIEQSAFFKCGELARVAFRGDSRLEELCAHAFQGSGIEEFVAPSSLRTVQQEAFAECGHLRRVVLNEGLQKLGSEDGEGVFHDSALEEVVLPSTLL